MALPALKIVVPHASIEFSKDNIRKALRSAALDVIREARALTQNPNGGGRAYSTPAGMSKGIHYASAAGEPPAMLTGTLNKSFGMRSKGSGTTIILEDNAYYAKFLELGAHGGAGTNQKGGKGTSNTYRLNPLTRKKERVAPTPTPGQKERDLEPRPFLSRALVDQTPEIIKKVQDAAVADMKFETDK
jgi:hypothetical protein